jgi:hypothetical protein
VGHCTSPIFRAVSGGIETAIEAYDTCSARSLSNIAPSAAVARFRVVAISTGTIDVPSVPACATGSNAPWGRRLQAQQYKANPMVAIVDGRMVLNNAIIHYWVMTYYLARRRRKAGDTGNRTPVDSVQETAREVRQLNLD